MDPQFEELAERLKGELKTVFTDQLAAVETRLKDDLTTVVTEQFAAAESRLVGQYKIHAEEMKEQVKLAAEGYGATLENIERSLKDLAGKWDTKITDHDLVLANHAKRIENLEHSR